jgi:hypothetical protein
VIIAGLSGNAAANYIARGVGRSSGQTALWQGRGRRIRLHGHDLDRANR